MRVRSSRYEVRAEAVDAVGQHRVADAEDRVRKLGDDRRIDRGVVVGFGQELVDIRLHRAGELLEHEVLILHLGREAGRLEHPFTVPHAGGTAATTSMNSASPVARIVALSSSTCRLCSEWNTW